MENIKELVKKMRLSNIHQVLVKYLFENSDKEFTTSQMADYWRIPKPTCWGDLDCLAKKGIIKYREEGIVRYYTYNAEFVFDGTKTPQPDPKTIESLIRSLPNKPMKLKKEKKSGEPEVKGPGIIASVLEFITESKNGITKEEIGDRLALRFPDKDKATMIKTLNCQIYGNQPVRMERERKITFIIKDGKYKKKK